LNPVMAKALDVGPVRATVFKSALNGVTAYGIWRFTSGKKRTALLGLMFALNAFDAIHDIRQSRQWGPPPP
jgi:hypothetical protein